MIIGTQQPFPFLANMQLYAIVLLTTLMTVRQSIGAEAAAVFDALQKGEVLEETKELMVAPNCLQSNVVELMEE